MIDRHHEYGKSKIILYYSLFYIALVTWSFFHINFVDKSKTFAPGAVAVGRIERKMMRCRLIVRNSGGRAHQFSAEVTSPV